MKNKKILVILILVIMIFAIATFMYTMDYYHAKSINQYLESTENIKIKKDKNGIYFDGPGEDKMLIFYPGAKVEYTAYSELAYNLSLQGLDSYIVKMPANLAILGIDKADSIIKEYNYKEYYLAGHSLGGAMAAKYTKDNLDKIDGLFLLAAYSTEDISESNLKVKVIYGSNDKVLNMESLKKYEKNLPNTYEKIVIEGGNHASFGSYGNQKGDGELKVDKKEQINKTINEILKNIN